MPWSSIYPGKMHACGHDGNTATLLARAKYWSETRRVQGKVRAGVSAGEEGGHGTMRMMEYGLLEKFPFDQFYGWHNYPYE